MSIYHCAVKIGSRTKGQSAVAASAYRAGDILTDQETGISIDYTRKSGIVFSEISLCQNAPSAYADREILWNAVHRIEKSKNAQLWREIEVALPRELNRQQQIEAVRTFVRGLTDRGMCADWSIHDKGDGNPHAHIMLTMRSIEPDGKWAPKSRKVYDLDENGERIYQGKDSSGRKQYKNHKEDYNDWNARERIEEWRAAWAACCNAFLAEAERIDHRSYARQGIERVPTVHEGYRARQIVREGGTSERVQQNEGIRHTNRQLQEIEEQLRRIEQEIAELQAAIREKGRELSGRMAELIARRNRTVDGSGGGIAGGERDFTEEAADSRAEAILRAADAALEGSAADSASGAGDSADTERALRESEAAVAAARDAERDSAAGRADREAARERLRDAASRRVREAEQRAREEDEARSRSHSRGGRSR